MNVSPTLSVDTTVSFSQEACLSDGGTAADLMKFFSKAWNSQANVFGFSYGFFNREKFVKHLLDHSLQFKKPDFATDKHFGFVEKVDLNPTDRLYIRADLHGDLKSLIENLQTLQKKDLLDENYKCREGVHLVFLGDYCDRGLNCKEILELLMRLREENPGFVHIIRGNHEYCSTIKQYGGSDPLLLHTVEAAESAVEGFFETMALSIYLGVAGENREYIQCTHGLFEVTFDPQPLLDHPLPNTYLNVTKTRRLSERIQQIADGESPLAMTAKRIRMIATYRLRPELTAYNWGDVTDFPNSAFGDLSMRAYAFTARDISYYFALSSTAHKVKMLFRGHEHKFKHLVFENKVIVTTLPVGVDCPAYSKPGTQDRAYIIDVAPKIEEWTKRAIIREHQKPSTDFVTIPYPLTSSDI